MHLEDAAAFIVATSMQGYADLERPAHPIQHIAAFTGPALLPVLASEAKKQGNIMKKHPKRPSSCRFVANIAKLPELLRK